MPSASRGIGTTLKSLAGATAAGVAMATAATAAAQATLLGLAAALFYDTYAAGTAYSLTSAAAAIVFGTTSPSITIAVAGTYRLKGRLTLKYNGATFAAVRTITLKLRRTNNTAADVTNTTITVTTGVVTTLSQTLMRIDVPEVSYIAAAGDVVTIFASLDVVPTAGSLDVTDAEIHASRAS